MISFHIPEDKELLAALGIVTLKHEHLNHILKMTIKTIADLRPAEAFNALKFEGSRALRQRANKLAKKELGESAELLKLQAILNRIGVLTEKRNSYIHGLWAKELDNEPGIMAEIGELSPLPTVEELMNLSNSMDDVIQELNQARLEGFLKDALNGSTKK